MRPEPKIVLSHTDYVSGKVTEVIENQGVFFVVHNNNPIGVRMSNTYHDNVPKYRVTTFTQPAHAYNLAEKLNKVFATDAFKVKKSIDDAFVVEEDALLKIERVNGVLVIHGN